MITRCFGGFFQRTGIRSVFGKQWYAKHKSQNWYQEGKNCRRTLGGNPQRPRMLSLSVSSVGIFHFFKLQIIFPKLNSVNIICFIQYDTIFSLFISLKYFFNCIFYYLTSEHLAPSSGPKGQLISIILLSKKLSLYLQHVLRIYLIKYRCLVSMNQHNIIMRNIVILQCIDFFPHP